MVENILQCLWAFLGSLGFGVFFNVHGKNLFYAALGGLVGWIVYLVSPCFTNMQLMQFFWASVAISLYSELLAMWRKCPVTVFLVASMIPLVPGGTIYYTMESLLLGDTQKFIELGVSTFEIAGSIAMGILASSFAVKLVKTLKRKSHI